MTLDEAKQYLKKAITEDGSLFGGDDLVLFRGCNYVAYPDERSTNADRFVYLDGRFSADDLEAIVVYMRQAPHPPFGESNVL